MGKVGQAYREPWKVNGGIVLLYDDYGLWEN